MEESKNKLPHYYVGNAAIFLPMEVESEGRDIVKALSDHRINAYLNPPQHTSHGKFEVIVKNTISAKNIEDVKKWFEDMGILLFDADEEDGNKKIEKLAKWNEVRSIEDLHVGDRIKLFGSELVAYIKELVGSIAKIFFFDTGEEEEVPVDDIKWKESYEPLSGHRQREKVVYVARKKHHLNGKK